MRVGGALWIAAIFAASLLIRIGDSDIWWHVRAGRWILENGAIPTTDPFSHTHAGRPWRYTEALAQVYYATLDALGGADALVIAHALGGALLLSLALRHARGRAAASAVAGGLLAASIYAAMTLKPQLFSYLGFTAVLGLVGAAERGRPRALWLAPPLFVLWANLHRGGLVGLVVLASAAAVWSTRKDSRDLAVRCVGVLVLSGLALLVSSGGVYYYTSALDVLGRSSFRELLAEWQPTTVEALLTRHLALVPLALLAIGERAARRRRGVDLELLVMIATAVLATRAARLVPFFAIAATPAAVRALDGLIVALQARVAATVRPALITGSALALAPAALAAHVAMTVPPYYRGTGVMELRVPVALATFLRESPPPGRMWHAFDFGGYFVYALAPEQPVWIDGRNDTVYEDGFFLETMRAAQDPETFHAQVEQHDVGFAVVTWQGPGAPGFEWLHADPEWQLVYWDDLGAVLVRRRPESEAYLAAHGYAELRVDTAFLRAESPVDDPSDRLLVQEMLRNMEQAPDSLRAAWLAAHALRLRGADVSPLRDQILRVAEERGTPLPDP